MFQPMGGHGLCVSYYSIGLTNKFVLHSKIKYETFYSLITAWCLAILRRHKYISCYGHSYKMSWIFATVRRYTHTFIWDCEFPGTQVNVHKGIMTRSGEGNQRLLHSPYKIPVKGNFDDLFLVSIKNLLNKLSIFDDLRYRNAHV